MTKRKTVNLEFLKDSHERMTLGSLENPAFIANIELGKAVRSALNIALESALFEANDYRGFSYIGDYKIDDTARRYF
jgi:hypothetical protein